MVAYSDGRRDSGGETVEVRQEERLEETGETVEERLEERLE